MCVSPGNCEPWGVATWPRKKEGVAPRGRRRLGAASGAQLLLRDRFGDVWPAGGVAVSRRDGSASNSCGRRRQPLGAARSSSPSALCDAASRGVSWRPALRLRRSPVVCFHARGCPRAISHRCSKYWRGDVFVQRSGGPEPPNPRRRVGQADSSPSRSSTAVSELPCASIFIRASHSYLPGSGFRSSSFPAAPLSSAGPRNQPNACAANRETVVLSASGGCNSPFLGASNAVLTSCVHPLLRQYQPSLPFASA